MYIRQTKTSGLGNNVLSRSTIILTPLPTRSFNPDGASEGQRWGERGNGIEWSSESSLEAAKHSIQLGVDGGRGPLNHEGYFMTGKRHDTFKHSTGSGVHGREVLVTPHLHLRTRSLSGFHRETAR